MSIKMSESDSDPIMTVQNAVEIIESACNLAQSRGILSLKDAGVVYMAINVLKAEYGKDKQTDMETA